jgi:hypothetical protein
MHSSTMEENPEGKRRSEEACLDELHTVYFRCETKKAPVLRRGLRRKDSRDDLPHGSAAYSRTDYLGAPALYRIAPPFGIFDLQTKLGLGEALRDRDGAGKDLFLPAVHGLSLMLELLVLRGGNLELLFEQRARNRGAGRRGNGM